jgi:hypothetical protein
MLDNAAVEYPEPDEDESSNEAILPEPERNPTALPHAPPPPKAVLFCPLPSQVRHLKGWLKKCCGDHFDMFYVYGEMGNDKCTDIQVKVQDFQNPSGFVTTP